jgi:hypothetical protein
MDKRTKQLFEWAAVNSETGQTPESSASNIDPGVINAILGPDDSQLMVESMAAIKNSSLSLEDRYESIGKAKKIDSIR